MYSGITRGTRKVVEKRRFEGHVDLVVDLEKDASEKLELGASVACDGVCLTVAGVDGTRALFQIIPETLERTTLGELEVGSLVSVERSYRIGDEMGGHEVAGHVIGTGRISQLRRAGGRHDLSVSVPPEWMKYILPKGFIAVDGSSLTVGHVDPAGSFELHLIPETLRLTKFGSKGVGDRVNIELDARTVAIVDTVERVLAQRQTG
ncbi:MAG TPA: riboflavin synthase subunit alpha [Polyangiaceae bacterium]|nr:riboflavin synthase subunit alpha [Polyangiaceae bacterium]